MERIKNRPQRDSETESCTTSRKRRSRSAIVSAMSPDIHAHCSESLTCIMTRCLPEAHWLSTAMNATHVQCVAV